ncbi:MAG: endonuclease MutS2 [Nitrospirota bacterium]
MTDGVVLPPYRALLSRSFAASKVTGRSNKNAGNGSLVLVFPMMNEHALKVLEYDKVRELVARFAVSEPGKASVQALAPMAEREQVMGRLAETREFLRIREAGEHPPLDGIRDIGRPIEKLRVAGMMLLPAELVEVAETLGAARRLTSFFQRFAGTEVTRLTAPRLCALAGAMRPLKHLEDAVHAAIDETGEIKDSASPELRRVRKLIGRTRDGIMERLSRILRDADAQSIIQEQLITVRDDRYVMPLKPNFRQSIKGVVHGHSGSRATLFVEPLEVVEQNNRLSELRMEEREEQERILRELSRLLAAEVEAIDAAYRTAAEIDAVHARARFGTEFGGSVPELVEDGTLHLRAARHPLIVEKRRAGAVAHDAVPNDIDLSGGARALVISGPNAGGKTVILKTIGILCLMAQSGIPVTAAEGSRFPLFGSVFADIGDEQSLEQDLSTFSAHAGRIAGILRAADKDSLVLLDELASGTDPAEGAALGAAVLARLLELGCVSVITTHHSSLKLFGAKTAGAVNAAMEFDIETLKPTYRFIPGRPGRSYGLDMASRLGIPENVVQDARSRLTADEAALDRLLEQVEQDGRQLRSERQQAEQDLTAARRLKAEAEQLHKAASDEERIAKAKAKQEAREVLAALRQKLKDLSRIAALDRSQVEFERRDLADLAKRLEPGEEEQVGPPRYRGMIHPGDRVRMPRLKRTGTVLYAHDDELEVDADGLKLKIALRDAVPVEAGAAKQQPSPVSGWSADVEEHEGLPDRVNLLGLRVDEALVETERFLDRAGMRGFRQVIIIHGLGTGALKAAVTKLLKDHPLIAAIRTGEPSEGGAGVTVAELKR